MTERFESNKTQTADRATEGPNFDVVAELRSQKPETRNNQGGDTMAQFPPEVQLGARQLASGLAHAADDNEARQQFMKYAREFKSYGPIAVGGAANLALREEGVTRWEVGTSSEHLWLLLPKPEGDDELKLKSQFFGPDEDAHAQFNPDKQALESIANRFVAGQPKSMSQADLAASLNATIAEMKRAGAGPEEAENAINAAFQKGKQDLGISITRRGTIRLYTDIPAPDPLVVTDLDKL